MWIRKLMPMNKDIWENRLMERSYLQLRFWPKEIIHFVPIYLLEYINALIWVSFFIELMQMIPIGKLMILWSKNSCLLSHNQNPLKIRKKGFIWNSPLPCYYSAGLVVSICRFLLTHLNLFQDWVSRLE